MKKERSSNIELLRILAILLVVQSHFAFHGYQQDVCHGDWGSIDNTLNQVLLRSMITGNLGNMLFMMITGFFLCKSTSISFRKLISVVVQVFTYSIVCYVVYTVLLANSEFRIKDLFIAATPLIHNTWWYFSMYVLVYIFHPYLNCLINNMNQKEHGMLILIMLVVWNFIPTFLGLQFGSSSFLVFCIFYFIGAYFRLYYVINKGFSHIFTRQPHIQSNNDIYIWTPRQNKVCLFICIFLWIGISALNSFIPSVVAIRFRTNCFNDMGSPLAIALSISLFVLFLNMTAMKSSKLVNTLVSCTGGVYLLHMDPYVRSILYTRIFHLERYVELNGMFFITFVFVLITFVVCTVVELARKKLYDSVESLFVKNK